MLEPLIPHKPPAGRPYNEHRSVVLCGILWVARTGCSWREMPEEFGKWGTAYKRYELRLGQRVCGSASSERWERKDCQDEN